MRSRRFPSSNHVFRLSEGTEDNDLHVRTTTVGDYFAGDPQTPETPVMVSLWEPSQAERAELSSGANVELAVVGRSHPPVCVSITHEQPTSRPQRLDDSPRVWLELPVSRAVELLEVVAGTTDETSETSEGFDELMESLRRSVEAAIRQSVEEPRGPTGEHPPSDA